MNDLKDFDIWCEKLAIESGMSYFILFQPHLKQIKNKWAAFDNEIAESVNAVFISLYNHNLVSLLIEFTELLENKMMHGDLLKMRLRMYINYGIALNMQNSNEEAEVIFKKVIKQCEAYENSADEVENNIIGSAYYNYARLDYSRNAQVMDSNIEKAIHHFKLGNYNSGLASCYGLKAVLLPKEMLQEKIALFLQAAEYNKLDNRMNDYAMRLANIGYELVQSGAFKQGLDYLNQALEVNLKNVSAHHLGMNYLMLADVHLTMGELANAAELCNHAEERLHQASITNYNEEIERIRSAIKADS